MTSVNVATPTFIDAAHAADMLHVSRDRMLDLIRERGLRTYGGRSDNPFVRSADITGLVDEIGAPEDEAPRRVKSPSSRVQARLTADARWAEVGEEDIGEWAARVDSARMQAARKAAEIAIERLQLVLQSTESRS